MFPSISGTDEDHSEVALLPDIPSSMRLAIKEVDARIQSLCNDDHSKINKLHINTFIYKHFIYITIKKITQVMMESYISKKQPLTK